MALDDIYKETILDHYKHPRNKRELPEAERSCTRNNPLCGDEITVLVHLEGDRIGDVAFQGAGCSISTASASMMTEALKGKTRGEAQALFARFREVVTGHGSEQDLAELGEMAAMAGVSRFPTRVKCATLGWHSALAALGEGERKVSTEE